MDLALDVAKNFNINTKQANNIINSIKKVIKNWNLLAKKYRIEKEEKDYMSKAFISE